MTALETLRAHYEDPARPLRAWRDRGGRVAGYHGADVPRELLAAAGFLPFRLRGSEASSAAADRILGTGVGLPERRVLASLLEGTPELDLLVLAHGSDSAVRLFTSLRVLPEARPALLFLDLLHLPTETTARYDLARLRELRAALERLSGSRADDERLRAAVAEANETRRLLGSIAELRRASPPRLSGSDALAMIGAGTALPASEYNGLLAALAGEQEQLPEPVARLYLVGSSQPSARLYRALETAGLHVVGEDHDWGEALADGLVAEAGDPLEAIAARFHTATALARRSTNARAAQAAREATAAGADLVVSWIRAADGALAWGIPAMRQALAAAGIPLVVFDRRSSDTPTEPDLARLTSGAWRAR